MNLHKTTFNFAITTKILYFKEYVLDKLFKRVLFFCVTLFLLLEVQSHFHLFGYPNKDATALNLAFVFLVIVLLFTGSIIQLFVYNESNKLEISKKLYEKMFNQVFYEDALYLKQYIQSQSRIIGYDLWILKKTIDNFLKEEQYKKEHEKEIKEIQEYKNNLNYVLVLKEKEDEIQKLKKELSKNKKIKTEVL